MIKRCMLVLTLILGLFPFLAAPAAAQDPITGMLQSLFPNLGIENGDHLNGGGYAIPRSVVSYPSNERPGTVIVDSPRRRLFLILGDGTALQYGIGVGRPGFEWGGVLRVSRKAEWPGWHPPADMRRRRPDLPSYMPGGIRNPLGARALYLGSSLYRIHGSNEPRTIGMAVSSGCIRMTNDDVKHLYDRVAVGAKVIIIRG